MEGFSRIDMYDTKGIEYLFVIGYLIILIVFWKLANKRVYIKTRIQEGFNALTANILRVPRGLFYSRHHTWTYLEKSGAARVGVDDLLQHIVGEVKFRDVRKPGDIIRQGDVLAEIDQEGKQLSILSPISGEILNLNAELHESPELLNEDPYEKGWIYKIRPSDWKAETNTCYLAEDAMNWAANELERFKDFLAASVKKYTTEPAMVILQDGGELRDHTLTQLPDEVWQDFQKDFLNSPAEK